MIRTATRHSSYLILVLLASVLAGCGGDAAVRQADQQIAASHARTYQAGATQVVDAMTNVLKERNFRVTRAPDGLSAVKRTVIENDTQKYWAKFFAGENATWRSKEDTQLSVRVEPSGGGTRVQLEAKTTPTDNKGAAMPTESVEDGDYYNRLLDALDEALGVRRPNP